MLNRSTISLFGGPISQLTPRRRNVSWYGTTGSPRASESSRPCSRGASSREPLSGRLFWPGWVRRQLSGRMRICSLVERRRRQVIRAAVPSASGQRGNSCSPGPSSLLVPWARWPPSSVEGPGRYFACFPARLESTTRIADQPAKVDNAASTLLTASVRRLASADTLASLPSRVDPRRESAPEPLRDTVRRRASPGTLLALPVAKLNRCSREPQPCKPGFCRRLLPACSR